MVLKLQVNPLCFLFSCQLISDFSSGPGSAHRHSERSLSRSRDVREQDPANQRREPEPQHNRRGSANTGRRNR